MKKMNVAVMLLDLSGEFPRELISGVSSYFTGKDVNTLICQVKLPNLPYGFFEYQYWAGLPLIESDSVDAVIVVSSFFASSVPVDVFSKWLKGIAHKPVVSVGAELLLPNSSYIRTDCSNIYNELIEHLKNKHGCKKIAFMSANDTQSFEAKERYEAYVKGLEGNNIPFDKSLVFDGNFTTESGERAMKDFNSKESIPFDAILCANDLMAIGVYNQLSSIGVEIPKDVIVTGFDDSYQAHMIEPTLTTVSQMIFMQGYKAAEIIYKKLTGQETEKENKILVQNFYRQSCGCIDRNNHDIDYILNDNTAVSRQGSIRSKSLDDYLKSLEDRNNIYNLMDVIQVPETLTDLFVRFKQILFVVDMRRMALVLFDEPIRSVKGSDFKLPDEVELALVLDRENGQEIISPKIRFNPHKELLPENILNDDYAEYIMEPVFFGEKQYGYTLVKQGQKNYNQTIIYVKAFCSAIASSYEYTRKHEENLRLSKKNEDLKIDNSQLNESSKTDELTQVFNRRGFMFGGNQVLSLTQSRIRKGSVFFCDMDGLKTINDTYGHQMGDAAIKCVADALKNSFRLNDIIGRLGGDEFAIISAEISASQFEEKYNTILKNCKKLAKQRNLPFDVSVSAGVVEFTNTDTNLEALLAKADEKQYELKKEKKAARANENIAK